MDLIKVISTEFDKAKRRIVKLLHLGRSDVKTANEIAPYGIDGNPIKGMIAVYSSTSINGSPVIIGYINKNQLADVGELRLYSTDKDGALKFYTWLKNDGTYEMGGNADNAVRYSKLEQAFNQLKADFNSHITAYNTHVHIGVTTGGGSSGTTSPGTSSAADISGAKINEIKTS